MMVEKNGVFQRTERYVSISKSGNGINIVIGGDAPGMGYVLTAPVSAVLKVIAGCARGVSLDVAPLNVSPRDVEGGEKKRKLLKIKQKKSLLGGDP